jgi:hypothetical protein
VGYSPGRSHGHLRILLAKERPTCPLIIDDLHGAPMLVDVAASCLLPTLSGSGGVVVDTHADDSRLVRRVVEAAFHLDVVLLGHANIVD